MTNECLLFIRSKTSWPEWKIVSFYPSYKEAWDAVVKLKKQIDLEEFKISKVETSHQAPFLDGDNSWITPF